MEKINQSENKSTLKNESFGANYLVKALEKCSKETREEVSKELEKLAEEVENKP